MEGGKEEEAQYSEAQEVHYQSIACDDFEEPEEEDEEEEEANFQQSSSALPVDMCNQLTDHILSRMEYDYYQTVYAERKVEQVVASERIVAWTDAGGEEVKSDYEAEVDPRAEADKPHTSETTEQQPAAPRIAPLSEERISSIQSIMRGVQLPKAVAPDWAAGIDWQSQQVQDYLSSLRKDT